jgi:hypothetical protein
VNFPLQNSNVAIHSLGQSGYGWVDPPGVFTFTPQTLAISDAPNTYYTNTQGSDSDPAAFPYFPYNIPRPQCDCTQWYTSVYFNLARPATQFGVYLPTGSNQPYTGYDDSNYNYLIGRHVYVGVLGPNDTFATATYTDLTITGYCPFLKITDPAGGIKGVVVMDDMNSGLATFGFMDVYATMNAAIAPHPGDANNDGTVDVVDLGILSTNYDRPGLPHGSGQSWGLGDFDDNGAVDVVDLGILSTNYDWVAAGSPLPEPATLSLLGLAAAALIRRKR